MGYSYDDGDYDCGESPRPWNTVRRCRYGYPNQENRLDIAFSLIACVIPGGKNLRARSANREKKVSRARITWRNASSKLQLKLSTEFESGDRE